MKEQRLAWYIILQSVPSVAVSCGYDTCFSVKACDGLYQLIKSIGMDWNTIGVSVNRVDLCQTHCKQVPDFSRPPGSDQVTWAKWANSRRRYTIFGKAGTHVASLQFLPSGQYGLCFGYCFSGPLPLRSHYNSPPLGVCFRESLVFRLHSDIGQIHLSIEAQCGTACLPMGDCHKVTLHLCRLDFFANKN